MGTLSFFWVLSVNNKLGFIKQSDQFEDRNVASEDLSNYKIVSINDYAFIRAGFRGYGEEGSLNKDDYFEKNVENAIMAGINA